jgi:hypothetical protein
MTPAESWIAGTAAGSALYRLPTLRGASVDGPSDWQARPEWPKWLRQQSERTHQRQVSDALRDGSNDPDRIRSVAAGPTRGRRASPRWSGEQAGGRQARRGRGVPGPSLSRPLAVRYGRGRKSADVPERVWSPRRAAESVSGWLRRRPRRLPRLIAWPRPPWRSWLSKASARRSPRARASTSASNADALRGLRVRVPPSAP